LPRELRNYTLPAQLPGLSSFKEYKYPQATLAPIIQEGMRDLLFVVISPQVSSRVFVYFQNRLAKRQAGIECSRSTCQD